ncbi:MAG: deoxynucleoside kinase [Anaerolineales bacterium]|nr:deoxynucleoside kinase [Anaerolineales bacterium]
MYIAIEGAIGVGKTTLSRLLSSRFQAYLLLEVFEENPFLADFYANRDAYAFQTQIFFLLSRYHQQQEVPAAIKTGNNLIADYTFEKDALFARLNLDGDELVTYFSVHNALGEKLPLPDLIVYLQAETSVLMQRIAQRDRPYERNMDQGYIESLNAAYDKFYSEDHAGAQVLRINTNQLNYVANEQDLDWVENRIRQTLEIGPYQTQFFHKA